MPLPANVSTGTVTGFFMDSSGNPMNGNVRFKPSPKQLTNVGAVPPTVIVPQEVIAPITNGVLEIELVATDDPDNNPVDWTYQAIFSFYNGGQLDTFHIEVPSDGTVDLATVAPSSVSGGTQILTPRGVPAGGTSGQVLVKETNADYETEWADLEAAGPGIPAGGTTGQVLAKTSNTDYVAGWTTPEDPPAALSELTDVNLTGLADGEILEWDSTTSKWIAVTPSTGVTTLAALTDVNLAGLADGEILEWDTTTSKWIAVTPSSGASALTSLTDVNVTGVANNDVLQYDSATSKWKNVSYSTAVGTWEANKTVTFTRPFTEFNKSGAPVSILTTSTLIHTHTVVSGDLCTASDSGDTYPLGFKPGMTLAASVNGAGLSGSSTTNGHVTINGATVFTHNASSSFASNERRNFLTPAFEVQVGDVINWYLTSTVAGAVCDYVLIRTFPTRIGTGLGPGGARGFFIFPTAPTLGTTLSLTNLPAGTTASWQAETSQRSMIQSYPAENTANIIPRLTGELAVYEGHQTLGVAAHRLTSLSTNNYDGTTSQVIIGYFDEITSLSMHRLFAPGRPS